MDSEHRHELEENVLATWLGEKLEKIAPHTTTIVGVVLAVIAASVGWTAYNANAVASEADAWRSFTLAVEGTSATAADGSALSLEMLRLAAEENPNSPVEDWAMITWADGRLWNAANDYLRNKPRAEEALAEAEEAYETLISADEAVISQRAHFGRGRAAEMRGDLEAAREHYGRVTGNFAELAARRVEQLDSPQTVEAYAWLTGVETAIDTPATDSDASTGDAEADPDVSLDALLESFGTTEDEAEDEGDESTEDASAEAPATE